MDLLSKNEWKNLFKEDFLQKLEQLKNCLSEFDTDKTEYLFVVTLSAAFLILRQYFGTLGIDYYKKKDLLKCAIDKNIIKNEQEWIEAINLSNRIGRAVRAKKENIPLIENLLKIYDDFIEFFDKITSESVEDN